MAALTPMQQDFVEYYLVNLNALEAAKRAGYSDKTAGSQGARLLKNVHVKAAIEARRKEKSEEIHLEQNRVLTEVAGILFARLDEVCDWSGEDMVVKNLNDIPVHARGAIKKITKRKSRRENDSNSSEEWVWAVEMHDKIRAAEFMGKYFGLTTGERGNDGDGGNDKGAAAARNDRILESVRRMAAARGDGKK